MAEYDGEEPSMTIAATPDDGTSRRKRRRLSEMNYYYYYMIIMCGFIVTYGSMIPDGCSLDVSVPSN